MPLPHFPPQGPIFEDDRDQDLLGGHPTSAGPTDKRLRVRPNVEESPGNGRPGIPRYRAREDRHGKVGSIIVGPFPSGPKMPGVDYDSGPER